MQKLCWNLFVCILELICLNALPGHSQSIIKAEGLDLSKLYTSVAPEDSIPRPNPRQLAWQEAELGVIFHFEIWFDGGASHPDKGAPDVLPIVKKYQPNCLFYHNEQLAEARWGGSETGTVGYPCWATFPNPWSHAGDTPQEHLELLKHGDPAGKYWMPAMADAPLRGHNGRHEWFWEPGDETHIYPLEALLDLYYQSVGRNATLILGMTPDPRGLIPDPDVQRVQEFGAEIRRRFGNPSAQTQGTGYPLILELKETNRISDVMLQEDIQQGERVRSYLLEGYNGNAWFKLGEGSCIGHKRIHRLSGVSVFKIKLKIVRSVGGPKIKSLAAFAEN